MKAYKAIADPLYCVVTTRAQADEIVQDFGRWGDEITIEEIELSEEMATALAESEFNGLYERAPEEEYQRMRGNPTRCLEVPGRVRRLR